jgi:hypothetical protein
MDVALGVDSDVPAKLGDADVAGPEELRAVRGQLGHESILAIRRSRRRQP